MNSKGVRPPDNFYYGIIHVMDDYEVEGIRVML